jgi:hypothetical protein
MKKRSILLSLGLAAGLLGLLAGPREASAAGNSGYVCAVRYIPLTTTPNGNVGYTSFSLFSGPSCTGSYLGYFTLHTTGTWAGTSSDQAYVYDSPGLLGMFQSLQRAAAADQRLYVVSSDSTAGYTYLIDFQSN